MNVGMIAHSAGAGGAERYLLDVAGVLSDEGARVFVALPREGPLSARLARMGVESRVFPYRWWAVRYPKPARLRAMRQAGGFLSAPLLARFFSRRQCNLLFTNGETVFAGALAARILQRPHIWQLHEIRDEWSFDWGDRRASRFMRRRTTRFVANSKATLESYRPHLAGVDSSVLYQAVRVERPPALGGRDGRSTFRCVVAGTVAPHKGQDEAIEALRRLRERSVAVSLDLVGDTPGEFAAYSRRLRRKIEEGRLQEVVRFLGFVEDPLPVIAGADALLVPSTEGFGRTIVEAMLAGTPVVARRSGAAPEILAHERTGLLYEPGDAEGLARQVEKLAAQRSEGKRIAAAAEEGARRRFDPVTFRKGLLEIFRTTLAASGGEEGR